MQNKIRQAAEVTTGTAAAGNTALPYDVYADYLVAHGIGIMSYADWSKLLGTVYIIALLAKMLFKLISWLWRKLKK